MFFAAKIAPQLRRYAQVESVKSLEQLEKLRDNPPSMVILDLNSRD
jgi:hypothetical protein